MSIKGRFIMQELQYEGNRLLANQTTAINSTLSSHSGSLINNRFISVTKNGELSATLTFKHTLKQRFLDLRVMKYGRKRVKRKRNIHNRFIYGHYNMIARKLMSGLTEEVAESLKQEFQQNE